jgi:nitrogen fixation protein FixH
MVAAAAFMGILVPAATWAQGAGGGHGHAHTGQEQKIGRYEVELVVRGTEATLLVRDEREQPVDAASFAATAVALARGNERRTLEFRPAGENRLAARIDFPFEGKFRATVTLRGPGGDLGTGRFNVDPVR